MSGLVFAILAAMLLGSFYPVIKVNYDRSFASAMLIPVLVCATAVCYVLAIHIGWWTALAYPLLYVVGTMLISPISSGESLGKLLFGGWIWAIACASVLMSILAVVAEVLAE